MPRTTTHTKNRSIHSSLSHVPSRRLFITNLHHKIPTADWCLIAPCSPPQYMGRHFCGALPIKDGTPATWNKVDLDIDCDSPRIHTFLHYFFLSATMIAFGHSRVVKTHRHLKISLNMYFDLGNLNILKKLILFYQEPPYPAQKFNHTLRSNTSPMRCSFCTHNYQRTFWAKQTNISHRALWSSSTNKMFTSTTTIYVRYSTEGRRYSSGIGKVRLARNLSMSAIMYVAHV